MKLQEFLDLNLAIDQAGIKAALDSIASLGTVYIRVARNFKIESDLEGDDWEEFVNCLLPSNKDPNEMIVDFSNFSSNGRELQGKAISLSVDKVFGRITGFNRYAMLVDSIGGHFSDSREIKRALRRRIGKDPKRISPRIRKLPLGGRIIWATFREGSNHPFGNPRLSKEEIVCSLGLPPLRSLALVFEYTLPRDVQPKIPTICDAYRQSGWHFLFLRVNESDFHGKTDPTPGCPIASGFPEAVHRQTTLQTLVTPLTLV